jgi:hypothetical protein
VYTPSVLLHTLTLLLLLLLLWHILCQALFEIEEAKLVKAEQKAKAKAEKNKKTIKKREKADNEMGRCKRRKLQGLNKAQV